MICIALNSSQPFYCQILILSVYTHKGICRKTTKTISPNDCPPSTENSKLNLAVRAVLWTSDNTHVLVQYETNCIAIISRAGQWVRILNPMNSLLPKKITIPKIFSKLPKSADIHLCKLIRLDVLRIIRVSLFFWKAIEF
jgi:hypothetical protein